MNEQPNNGNIILYQTEDGKSRIEVTLCNDTVWLTADHFKTYKECIRGWRIESGFNRCIFCNSSK